MAIVYICYKIIIIIKILPSSPQVQVRLQWSIGFAWLLPIVPMSHLQIWESSTHSIGMRHSLWNLYPASVPLGEYKHQGMHCARAEQGWKRRRGTATSVKKATGSSRSKKKLTSFLVTDNPTATSCMSSNSERYRRTMATIMNPQEHNGIISSVRVVQKQKPVDTTYHAQVR